MLVERPLRTSKWWQPDQNGGYVSRADFAVVRVDDDQFDLTGSHSKLQSHKRSGSPLFIMEVATTGP